MRTGDAGRYWLRSAPRGPQAAVWSLEQQDEPRHHCDPPAASVGPARPSTRCDLLHAASCGLMVHMKCRAHKTRPFYELAVAYRRDVDTISLIVERGFIYVQLVAFGGLVPGEGLLDLPRA